MASLDFGKRVGGSAAVVGGGKSFQKTEFFKLADGESGIYRFLTDYTGIDLPDGRVTGGWLPMNQHQNIRTKGTPPDFKGDSWPQYMAAPCRYDEAWNGSYPDCFICDNPAPAQRKPGQRFWALAVVREEVLEGGKLVGVRDKTRTVTRKNANGDEEDVTEKAILVVNMAYSNFFSLLDGYGGRYQTILDRDYFIRRKGSTMNDTKYTITPEEKITTTLGEEEVPFDLRNDALMARYLPEAEDVGYAQASNNALFKILEERTSDDFYGRFFDTRVTVATYSTPEGETAARPAQAQPAAPSNDVDPDRLVSMKERLTGYRPEEGQEKELVSSGSGLKDLG